MPRIGAAPQPLDHAELLAEVGAPAGVSADDGTLDDWLEAQQTARGPPLAASERASAGYGEPPQPSNPRAGGGRMPNHRSLAWIGRALAERAWLLVAGGAAILLIATMDFRPPTKVRVQQADAAELVGDAPLDDVDVQASPQSVVVRAELSRYEAPASELGGRPRGGDEDDPATRRLVLARPVVTTLYGLTATFEQTLRLEGGRHEVDVAVEVTPRVGDARRGELPPIRLERDVRIVSRRQSTWGWWDRSPIERLVMHEHATLADATQGTHQLTFAVDDQLFVLSLDVTRPSV
jgi:hypothetical protein